MAGIHGSPNVQSKNGFPPQELLDDLCSRFVLNVPKEDRQSFERVLFLVEYAHWFYEDNSVENNPSLKSLTLKEFTSLLFNSCDVFRPYVPHLDDIFKDFRSYKVRVPVTGAIILDSSFERCLLVKGWKGPSWSFPRGKKNKDEDDHDCAVREVLEETGFDVSPFLDKEEYVEMIFGEQRVRLYIITGVRDDTPFAPQTKKEISEISWQRLDELFPESDEVISRTNSGLKLYMVAPFLQSLREWISKNYPSMAAVNTVHNKGVSVWKLKSASVGGNLSAVESEEVVKSIVESEPSPSEPKEVKKTMVMSAFRNFRFDREAIFRAMQTCFSQ